MEASYNSGYANFFIMVKDEPLLDGMYAIFGKVTSGMNVIDKISNLPTKVDESGNTTGEPISQPIIKYMTVETFGIEYPQPETIETFDIQKYLYEYYYGVE